MPAERKVGTKPIKSERTHEENQERAYIAASRRSDRSLEARVESARRASEIHKKRTGKALRITEKDVMNEEMYEEEDDEIPQVPYRNPLAFYPGYSPNARLQEFLQYRLMVQQVMEQSDAKSSASSFQKYQFTTPQTFNPYAQGTALYSPLPYQDMPHAQQFLSASQHTAKSPVQQQLINRFHPYAKPNQMQKRSYPSYQGPVDSKYQNPPAPSSPQASQATQTSAIPVVAAPQKAPAQSPAMSQSTNQSPTSQAQTPTLTHSSAGSTPGPTAAASSPLATSSIVSTPQNEQINADNFSINPLGSAFTPDVQTFFRPNINSMLHSHGYNPDGVRFLKSFETIPSGHATIDQPQFTFGNVFDTSVFNTTTSLTNEKSCTDTQQAITEDEWHYTDVSFGDNTIDQKNPSPQSISTDLLSPTVSLDQLKIINGADLYSDSWLPQDLDSWPADESLWSPLGDLEGWANTAGPPSVTGASPGRT